MHFTDIIWDFDGTLFDTYPAMARAFQRALRDGGIDEPMSSVLGEIKVSIAHAIEHYRVKYDIPDYSFADRFNRYEKELDTTSIYPFDGIETVCRSIIEANGHNYIYTHRGRSIFNYLEHHGLLGLFRDIVHKGYNLPRKPEPSGFLYIIDKYSLNKAQVLAVGDRGIDIVAARNAGVKACLISNGEPLDDCKPDYIIDTVGLLSKIL